MAEPLFFDCLTDAQFWSLFDAGVLHGYMLPVEVYERLERIAPDHGCYLFTWPEGLDLPSLQDLIPGVAMPRERSPAQTPNNLLETRGTLERMRSAIEAFCAQVNTDSPAEGVRIHIIATHPRPALRLGPYLEPQPRELSAMSLAELEVYLDAVLRLDEGDEVDPAPSSASS